MKTRQKANATFKEHPSQSFAACFLVQEPFALLHHRNLPAQEYRLVRMRVDGRLVAFEEDAKLTRREPICTVSREDQFANLLARHIGNGYLRVLLLRFLFRAP